MDYNRDNAKRQIFRNIQNHLRTVGARTSAPLVGRGLAPAAFQYQIQFVRIGFDHFFSLFSLIFSLKTPFTKNKLAAASFHPLRNSLANLKTNRCRAKKGEQRNEHSFLVLSSLERKTKNRALNISLPVVYTNS